MIRETGRDQSESRLEHEAVQSSIQQRVLKGQSTAGPLDRLQKTPPQVHTIGSMSENDPYRRSSGPHSLSFAACPAFVRRLEPGPEHWPFLHSAGSPDKDRMAPQAVSQILAFAGYSGASRRPVFVGQASGAGNPHQPVELLQVRRLPIGRVEEPGRDYAMENIRRFGITPAPLQLRDQRPQLLVALDQEGGDPGGDAG